MKREQLDRKQPQTQAGKFLPIKSGLKYTLGELIASVVQEEVNSVNQKNQNRLSPVISFEEIEEGKASGEIKFVNKSRSQNVAAEKAIENAIDAFKEGHFFVFVDDVQFTSLEDEISLKSDFKVVFLRLTPLVGG